MGPSKGLYAILKMHFLSLNKPKSNLKNIKKHTLLGTDWGQKKAKKYPKKGDLKNKSWSCERGQTREKREKWLKILLLKNTRGYAPKSLIMEISRTM